MPDLTAGTEVLAADFPPSQAAYDNTQILNVPDTGWQNGSPTVSATFLAATTGRAVVTVSAALRDSPGTNRIVAAPRVVNADTGVVFTSPSVSANGVSSTPTSTTYEQHSRSTLLEGLVPGDEYTATLQHRVFAASGQDIRGRQITVEPAR